MPAVAGPWCPSKITCRMHDGLHRALGPKIQYPPELYLRLNNSLHAWYGPPLGVAIQIGSVRSLPPGPWPGWSAGSALRSCSPRLRSSCRRQRWATISRRWSQSTCASAGSRPGDQRLPGATGSMGIRPRTGLGAVRRRLHPTGCPLLMRQAARAPSSGGHPSPERVIQR